MYVMYEIVCMSGLICRYKGTVDAFRSIVRENGVRGLWKGWLPNCQRAAMVSIGGIHRSHDHVCTVERYLSPDFANHESYIRMFISSFHCKFKYSNIHKF